VLRLMETFALAEVTHAIEDALLLSTISFDAVRHLLLCRIERSETSLYRSQFYSWATLAVSAASASMWEVESHPRRRRIDPPSRRSYVPI
jgi:hypothetical protein